MVELTRIRKSSLKTLAARFHALSDEKRLRIISQLRHGEKCVCDLTGALDAGQSLLSFHLKTLKDAGLVRQRRSGRWMYYSLDPDAIDEIEEFLGAVEHCVREDAASGGGCC